MPGKLLSDSGDRVIPYSGSCEFDSHHEPFPPTSVRNPERLVGSIGRGLEK